MALPALLAGLAAAQLTFSPLSFAATYHPTLAVQPVVGLLADATEDTLAEIVDQEIPQLQVNSHIHHLL